MFERIRMIFKLLIGKSILIYNVWTKEIICILGDTKALIKKRHDYKYIDGDYTFVVRDGVAYVIEEDENGRKIN